ncbi:putative cytochrome P450 oxidoreductase [Geopyxis carbonaria]|nr:putative cytochrome P450 oxidoreductase [Geopyxis carbonaria]
MENAITQTTFKLSVGYFVAAVKAHPFLTVLSLIFLRLFYNKFCRGLTSIPGPAIAAYTRLWKTLDVYQGDAHNTAIALHKKYGPVVRFGPKHVSIGDPAAIPTIYGLKANFTKTAFYPIQCISWKKTPQMNLFSTRSPAYHRDQKRLVGSAYNMASLLEMEPAVDSCTEIFLSKMSEYAKAGKSVDLGAWLQYYAFDVVGEVTFSKKLGFLEQGGDVEGMMLAIEGMLDYAANVGQMPEWHNVLLGNPAMPVFFPSMETWNAVLNFTLKAINSRTTVERDGELAVTDLSTSGSDMLSRWASVKKGDPDKMGTREIIVHLSTNVFAGSDTTAIALRAILYFLAKNPDKMKKAVAEIDAADAAGNLSTPISYKETTTHLPYMCAVIKEAMRVHPSVGLLLERHVPEGGIQVCGRHIPAGTVIGINAWVLHNDPKVFPNPERFEPERWMDGRATKEMEQSWFAFGAGSRTCIGRNISIMEMNKVVPELLRRFEVSIPGTWKTKNVWFVQQSNVIADLKERRRK